MGVGLLGSIDLPDNARSQLKERFNLLPNESIRISYLTGTGDVVGTFKHWQEGRHDPRVPVITYSGMFYDLIETIDAKAQIVTPFSADGIASGRVHFSTVLRPPVRNKLTRIRSEVEYTWRCVQAVNRFDPHVVLATTDTQPAAWRFLRGKRRLVLSAHNTFWPMGRAASGKKENLKRKIIDFQSAALDGAVCTSPECMRQIAEITKSRVGGLVEFPQVVEHYETVPPSDVAQRFLFLGRIERSKGVFMLLDAFVASGLANSGAILELAGTGNDVGELEGKIAELGFSSISYLGMLNAAQVHSAIERTDLIVCPTMTSFNEGLALVGFEGAAHGVPSLVSSVVPAAEVLGRGCAIFEADDSGALEAALKLLSSDPKAYRGLREGVQSVRTSLYDRSLSWGAQLYQVLCSLP